MEEVSHQSHHHQTEYLTEIEHLVQHTHWPISHAAQSLVANGTDTVSTILAYGSEKVN